MQLIKIAIILLVTVSCTSQQLVNNNDKRYVEDYLYHVTGSPLTIPSNGVIQLAWTTISSAGGINYLNCASPLNAYYCLMQMTEGGSNTPWEVEINCGPEISIPTDGSDPVIKLLVNSTSVAWEQTMVSGVNDINGVLIPFQIFPAYTTLSMEITGTPLTTITFPGEVVGREMVYAHLWWIEQ